MYICPICKEANEEHRNYCKECGNWLLSTKFPSQAIEKPGKTQKYYPKRVAKNNWIRNLFIVGIILFVLLALLSGKENIYALLALFGVVGFGLTVILAFIFAVTRSFKVRRSGLGFLLVSSVASVLLSITLTPSNLEAANSSINMRKANTEQVIPTNKQGNIIGDTVHAGKLTYIVKDVFQQKEILSSYDILTTEGAFIVMTVNVSNNDKQPRYVDKSMFKLHDSQGRSYDPDTKADIYINNESAFFLKNINPGISAEAKIVFEIPLDAKTLRLEVTTGLGFSNKESQFISIGSL